MKKVTIADYGIGNLLSVKRALIHCGAEVYLASRPEEILSADNLIVPGVGAFAKCMDAIRRLELADSLVEFASSGKPYLGICVGMQMLLDCSYEFGLNEGLGLIPGKVEKIDAGGYPVPIIGWKNISLDGAWDKFYFIHSYQAHPKNLDNVMASYSLEDKNIVAAVKKDNIAGVQFHPEKSGEAGLNFLSQFFRL